MPVITKESDVCETGSRFPNHCAIAHLLRIVHLLRRSILVQRDRLEFFCVTEVITQIKCIPQEISLCNSNRLAIARLDYTQEHPLHYTN